SKAKEILQEMDSLLEQINQATDIERNTMIERLDSIELELIQIKQRLDVLENQTEDPIEPPNNITDLHASSIDVNEITLSWTASCSPNFIVYDVSLDGVFLTHVTTTNVLITDLLTDTEYTFNVKELDNNDQLSSGVSVTVKTTEKPKE